MSKNSELLVSGQRRHVLERELLALVLRHGASDTPSLPSKVSACVAQLITALAETSVDYQSLSPFEVVRIRTSKFAASLTSPSLFRDPARLSVLRAEIQALALNFVGEAGRRF